MASNWTISKKVAQYATNYNSKDKSAFEFIVDIFVELLDVNSKKRYRQVINALQTEDVFDADAEKQFTSLLPKLIVCDKKDEMIKLIGLIRRSVCLHGWGENKKSYKTYCTTFIDFLEKFINSKAKRKNEIIEKLKKFYPEDSIELSQEEESILNESFLTHQVFLHDKLQAKFWSRLRGQSRTSGDKVWLPLDFIAKIFRHKAGSRGNGFIVWLYDSVEDIFIHYKDDDKIKSVCFKTDVFLDFEKNNDKYDVFVIWTKSKKPKRYRVYTPTGNGNEKIPMTVKDISQIDIDHVKPIDLTLRDLETKGKIKSLKKISEYYKKLDYPEKIVVDDTVWEELDINIDSLTEELGLIRKDGVLRLMDSSYNEQKSNGTTFKTIRKTQSGYIGIMMNDVLLVDTGKNTEIVIYQNLSENGKNYARSVKSMPKGREVKISKKIIDLL